MPEIYKPSNDDGTEIICVPATSDCRRLLGQNLSGLDFEDIKSLEHQLEISLHNIRGKKVVAVSMSVDINSSTYSNIGLLRMNS